MNDLTSKYVGIDSPYNPNIRFLENEINNYRILAFPGGTRSGKTYSIVQWIWRQLDRYSGVEYSIVRQTLPAVKGTVINDFTQIGQDAGLYTDKNHNLTEKFYLHNGNTVKYFSGDTVDKMKGIKQHLLYLNEGPELDWKVVQQLMFRTSGKILIDYNPSYPESWIYDNILTRKDCAFITTTYADNPHLPKAQVAEIDWMKDNDPDAYKIYGLGQRGEIRGQIYSNFKRIKSWEIHGAVIPVIDFGYSNDPCSIGEFQHHNRAIYGRELIYKTGMTNLDIAFILAFYGYDLNKDVIADSAEPKSIGELRRGFDISIDTVTRLAFEFKDEIKCDLTPEQMNTVLKLIRDGFHVHGAKKGPDSIRNGINQVKEHEVFVMDDASNAWKEYIKYKWKEDPDTGRLTNVAIDKDNHWMDCLRMFALNYQLIV